MTANGYKSDGDFRGDNTSSLHAAIEDKNLGAVSAHDLAANASAPNDLKQEQATTVAKMSWLDAIAGERILGAYSCGLPGPLILAVGGIHGNEPSGPRAIKVFFDMLKTQTPLITGTFLGLLGNLQACAGNQRYVDKDLNRCFIPRLINGRTRDLLGAEARELEELTHILHHLQDEFEDVCFVDCHTSAALTIPYLSINVHPESLRLANRFPLNNVIGLQQSIPGRLAEYCNKLNFRGFTFEAGQHLGAAAFSNQIAMFWLMLVYSGALLKADLKNFHHYEQMLALDTPARKQTYRLVSHYRLKMDEEFEMQAGFENFDHVKKGVLLARNRYGDIVAPGDGYLLMPLYQEKGEDGFFLLEEESEHR